MYIYDNEDNEPMNDIENLHHVTGYLSFEEMRQVESGEYSAHLAEKLEAEKEKLLDAIEGLADMLELTGKCRECPDFTELAEGFIDQNGLIANEQVDFLKMQCSICGGKGTGKPKDEKHEKWVEHHWDDLKEWVKNSGLKYRCLWCPNVYRIYGNYKDPDDEWEAIEDHCGKCKYFGED